MCADLLAVARSAILCDDDPVLRSVVAELAGQAGVEVLAETDSAGDAIELVERFWPDIVVLDLALAKGSGLDVIDHLQHADEPPRVILFTAFDGTGTDRPFVDAVRKPDFDRLSALLADSSRTVGERRRSGRTVAPPRSRTDTGLDDTDDFYSVLAAAQPEDTLVTLTIAPETVPDVALALRQAIRIQDRVIRRHDRLVALLIGGGAAAAPALTDRLSKRLPGVADRAAIDPVGDDPVATFTRVTERLAVARPAPAPSRAS